MSENENQQSTIAVNLCKNGCGFYGSTQFDGMCSVCYKDVLKKRQKHDEDQIQKPSSSPHSALLCSSSTSQTQQPAAASLATPAAVAAPTAQAQPVQSDGAAAAAVAPHAPCLVEAGSLSSFATDSSGTSGSTAESSQSEPSKKRVRCGICKKKVGLTGFDCRCGGVFCPAHRYSDKHDCQFDYQSHGQDQIRKANPQVVSSKIDKL